MDFKPYIKTTLSVLATYELNNKLSDIHPLLLGNIEKNDQNIKLWNALGLSCEDSVPVYSGDNLYILASLAMHFFMYREDQLSFPVYVNNEREGLMLHFNSKLDSFVFENLISSENVDKDIFNSFVKTLRESNDGYLLSMDEVLCFIYYYESSRSIVLALHDYTVSAVYDSDSPVGNYHYTDEFFERFPINYNLQHHLLLLQLAIEQRINTHAFECIYNATQRGDTI